MIDNRVEYFKRRLNGRVVLRQHHRGLAFEVIGVDCLVFRDGAGKFKTRLADHNLDLIDAIATDHAPVSAIEKDIEFDLAAPGISGLETAFGLAMRLVSEGALSLGTLIERLTIGPVNAWSLDRQSGFEGLGTLARCSRLLVLAELREAHPEWPHLTDGEKRHLMDRIAKLL